MILLEITMWLIMVWFLFLAVDMIYQMFVDSWKHHHHE